MDRAKAKVVVKEKTYAFKSPSALSSVRLAAVILSLRKSSDSAICLLKKLPLETNGFSMPVLRLEKPQVSLLPSLPHQDPVALLSPSWNHQPP